VSEPLLKKKEKKKKEKNVRTNLKKQKNKKKLLSMKYLHFQVETLLESQTVPKKKRKKR